MVQLESWLPWTMGFQLESVIECTYRPEGVIFPLSPSPPLCTTLLPASHAAVASTQGTAYQLERAAKLVFPLWDWTWSLASYLSLSRSVTLLLSLSSYALAMCAYNKYKLITSCAFCYGSLGSSGSVDLAPTQLALSYLPLPLLSTYILLAISVVCAYKLKRERGRAEGREGEGELQHMSCPHSAVKLCVLWQNGAIRVAKLCNCGAGRVCTRFATFPRSIIIKSSLYILYLPRHIVYIYWTCFYTHRLSN